MNISPFHMPSLEPGTLIRIRTENGGGYLLSCPQCNFLRFVGVAVVYWKHDNFVDTPQEIECPSCGVMFQIIANEIKYDIFHDESELKRTRKPELKTFGTLHPTQMQQKKLPERVTA